MILELARPNFAKTKRGASGGFLPRPLLLRLRHPNSEKRNQPKFCGILSPENCFRKTSSALFQISSSGLLSKKVRILYNEYRKLIMKKNIKILIAVIIFFLIVLFISKTYFSNPTISNIFSEKVATLPSCGNYETKNVLIGGQNVKMDVSDTDCKRELGLSGRNSLQNDTGMLFIFDKEGSYEFWMKDMNFSIDIIWVDSNFNITGIEKNLKPDTYPEAFGEKYLAKYVFELPAGFSDVNNIKVGNKISILEN